ncbi:hypothetical protein IID22_01045 [Patescibacteria group bacterium]|nr:hypothetical protein [Patescibacteria group bacterium]
MPSTERNTDSGEFGVREIAPGVYEHNLPPRGPLTVGEIDELSEMGADRRILEFTRQVQLGNMTWHEAQDLIEKRMVEDRTSDK